MIALASEYLYFKLAGGESVPLSVADIGIEISGNGAALFDDDLVRHAATAVFDYFRIEKCRESVSVTEFAEALRKVLTAFATGHHACNVPGRPLHTLVTDLIAIAESGKDSELVFFCALRAELRRQLSHAPRMLRFIGLRRCVKRLTGARRWTRRCRQMEEQIVDYLRRCLSAEPQEREFAVVVE
jgi:hypothetical protein